MAKRAPLRSNEGHDSGRRRELSSRSLLPRAHAALGFLVLAAAASGCGKQTPTVVGAAKSAHEPAEGGAPAQESSADRLSEALWVRARDGDEDDLTRLALHEGTMGLLDRAKSAMWRSSAIRAMAYAEGMAQLAWLAETAKTGSDDEAESALGAAAEVAARTRRSEDPEDAEEVRAACDRLRALVSDGKAPTTRRALALRVVRLLADQGCVAESSELEAR